MNVPEIIERKRDGEATPTEALAHLVDGVVRGTVPEYQISAWLMAVLFRGMERQETAEFTDLMMASGDVLEYDDAPALPIDKHSTGGVGDKISLPLAPLVAAAGGFIPMISGRGLGHTGGTLDKLESIPGLRTNLDEAAFRAVLNAHGFVIASASGDLAPADAKLYALRDVTGTVPSVPLITASILSKKYAAGVEALVLDVKCGSGAFMRDQAAATELAETLVSVSKTLGKRAVALVTTMDEPLGYAVGNALEVRESIDVLRGAGPPDIRELTLTLGAEMLALAQDGTPEAARQALESALASGAALERFAAWIEAQGGDPRVCDDPGRLPSAPHVREVAWPEQGYLAGCDAREVGFAANELGAGRTEVGQAVDPRVGFVFRRRLGEFVRPDEPFVEIHAASEADAERAMRRLKSAYVVRPEPPELPALVRKKIA